MIGDRLTTDQFHKGLQSCVACSVNGWPAVVEWAKEMPRIKTGKPYAVLRWTEYEDNGSHRTIFCNLKKAEIEKLQIMDGHTVRVIFNTNEEPIDVKLFLLAHLIQLCAPVRCCSVSKLTTLPGGLTLEDCSVNRLQGVN